MMNVHELAAAAQHLPLEQQQELIRTLFLQLPKATAPASAIVRIGNLELGTQEIRERVSESLKRSAEALQIDDAEP
ncbi:MAG TPA: hypothetical protein VGB07_27990 [Blastocatellia bacterium]